MSKNVNVAKTVEKWAPSEGARRVSEKKELDAIIQVLEISLKQGHFKGFMPSNEHTKTMALKDGLGLTGVVEAAGSQLKIHRTIWETHLDQTEKFKKKTYEMPVIAEAKGRVRYFKFYFLIEETWIQNPNLVKKLFVSYHEANPEPEIVYEKV